MTTTNLRTQSPLLVRLLSQGSSVSLVHRSKIVGVVSPVSGEPEPVTETALSSFLHRFRTLPLIPVARREQVYRHNLEKKYGQSIS